MTTADLTMIIAMLENVSDHAKEKGEDKTAQELDKIVDTLKQKQKDSK